MDYVADPKALMADINTLKILLMVLMIGSLLGFLIVLKKLQAQIDKLQATMNVHYKMTLSLMAMVPGAVQHNREHYAESDEEDLEVMNRKNSE